MRKIMKRAAVICMAFVMMLTMMPMLGALTNGTTGSWTVYAEEPQGDVNVNGCGIHLWYGDYGASVAVWSYNGGSEVLLPSAVSYGGKTYKAGDGDNWFFVEASSEHAPFKGNKTITKVAIPSGYGAISSGAFEDCTSLTEFSIGQFSEPGYASIGENTFKGCTSLKTYNIDSTGLTDSFKDQFKNSGIGTDKNGQPIAGVAVWTQEGSAVWRAIIELNEGRPDGFKITLNPCSDPYGRNTVSGTGGSGGSGSGMGEDGTAYGPGASESVVDKAITKYAKEKDPKGTTFGLLQARLKTAKKTSITLQWKSVKGAKKYIVYGNACGSKNKLKKMVKKTTKTKMTFKKVAGKKVKAGKPYKFVVVAIDKNGKVISTSKIVHAATKGGKKWVNAKSVTTKAKKDKVTIKKGKKFNLKAKTIAEKGKGKLIDHRDICYETSNKKVATVNSKGVITAKGKGTCTVYAYAHNGVFKAIKVTVN